jgi:5'-deoxynucleotidase YfbR-like HD superfamily hydrolase
MAIPFRTRSGRWLDLERPQPCDIDARDIASGLSKVCRFAGQIEHFYSVAHHSLFVSELVDPPFAFRALVHDATEAYLGDLSRWLKHSDYLKGYRFLESRLDAVITEALGLRPASNVEHHAIKTADNFAACYEQAVLRLHLPLDEPLIADMLAGGFIRGERLEDLVAFLPRVERMTTWNTPESALYLGRTHAEREDDWMSEFLRLNGGAHGA